MDDITNKFSLNVDLSKVSKKSALNDVSAHENAPNLRSIIPNGQTGPNSPAAIPPQPWTFSQFPVRWGRVVNGQQNCMYLQFDANGAQIGILWVAD